MAAIRTYALPFAGALLLHAMVVGLFIKGTSSSEDVAQVITPQVVNAKLLVIEPPKKNKQAPKPAAKKAPTPNAEVAPPPVPNSEPNNPEPPPIDEAAVAAEAERQRKALEAESRRKRLEALGELANDSLQRSLEAEAEQMLDNQSQQQVQTYQAGIYDLVRKNWSRPPSARNGMQARFVVELIPTGEVLSVVLVDGSGNGAFDRSAEQAILRARRFDVPDDNALFEANFRRFYFLFRPEDLLR